MINQSLASIAVLASVWSSCPFKRWPSDVLQQRAMPIRTTGSQPLRQRLTASSLEYGDNTGARDCHTALAVLSFQQKKDAYSYEFTDVVLHKLRRVFLTQHRRPSRHRAHLDIHQTLHKVFGCATDFSQSPDCACPPGILTVAPHPRRLLCRNASNRPFLYGTSISSSLAGLQRATVLFHLVSELYLQLQYETRIVFHS